MRTYAECVSSAVPSGFVWLVCGCLSIEKPHFQVRAEGTLNGIKATSLMSYEQTSFLLIVSRKPMIDRSIEYGLDRYSYAFTFNFKHHGSHAYIIERCSSFIACVI